MYCSKVRFLKNVMTVLGKTVQHRFFLQKLSPVILRILKSFFIKTYLKTYLRHHQLTNPGATLLYFRHLSLRFEAKKPCAI